MCVVCCRSIWKYFLKNEKVLKSVAASCHARSPCEVGVAGPLFCYRNDTPDFTGVVWVFVRLASCICHLQPTNANEWETHYRLSALVILILKLISTININRQDLEQTREGSKPEEPVAAVAVFWLCFSLEEYSCYKSRSLFCHSDWQTVEKTSTIH